jgi:hypothetical protein
VFQYGKGGFGKIIDEVNGRFNIEQVIVRDLFAMQLIVPVSKALQSSFWCGFHQRGETAVRFV